MTEREEYMLNRRRKKIKLNDIAKALKISQSLLSQYETGKCGMSASNQRKYREYIENYKKGN